MNALAQVDESSTVEDLLAQLNQRKQWHGQWVRGLQPFGKDNALLSAVHRGEFLLQGVRNRDLLMVFGFAETRPKGEGLGRCGPGSGVRKAR